MKILYIFPHPDDESYGPARVMAKQKRLGHEIFLLTLTKGGATKQRHKFNYSVEEMGEVRAREMDCVKEVLKLDGMTILDFTDSGLKEQDPRVLEEAIKNEIRQIKPEVIVSYPVHGISGFEDHLVMHAIAKNAFLDIQEERVGYLKRLAFFTIDQQEAEEINKISPFNIHHSPDDLIDCIETVDDNDIEKMKEALDCYKTYSEVIERTGIKENILKKVKFEIFLEHFDPPITDLTAKIHEGE